MVRSYCAASALWLPGTGAATTPFEGGSHNFTISRNRWQYRSCSCAQKFSVQVSIQEDKYYQLQLSLGISCLVPGHKAAYIHHSSSPWEWKRVQRTSGQLSSDEQQLVVSRQHSPGDCWSGSEVVVSHFLHRTWSSWETKLAVSANLDSTIVEENTDKWLRTFILFFINFEYFLFNFLLSLYIYMYILFSNLLA